MLRFQRAKLNVLKGKHFFWLELLLVSAAFHVVFLFCILVLYSGYRYSTKIIVKRSGVQLLPSYFMNPPGATVQSASQSVKKAAVVKRTPPKKAPSTVMKKEEPKKTAPKKQAAKQTAQTKKQQPTKKQQTPAPAKAKSEKPEQKKAEVKKKEISQHHVQKKNESKKEIVKETEAKQLVTSDLQEQCVLPANECDTMQIQQFIQREISKSWTPPIGLPEDLICTINIQIGGDGIVSDVVIEESSGALVYDLSAQAAAMELSLPRWAWGKEFSISFCQE